MKRHPFLLALCFAFGFGFTGVSANEIYDRVAPATAMFYDLSADGRQAWIAAGVLVDADKKLVVTAEHVVHRVIRDGTLKTSVMFPVLDKAGKINTNAAYYLKNRQSLSIAGDVIYFDRTKDVAIIQLEKAPAGVKAIPLATAELEPGDKLHVIGNSTFFEGGAFDHCAGTVRNQFYMHKTTVTPAAFPLRDYVFYSLCTDVPTNQGDSGGPTVNNMGELVAVISTGTVGTGNRQVEDTSVHFREIKSALDRMQQPSGDTLEVSGSVDQLGFDSFFLPVTKGNNLSAKLTGQGTTDLDLYLKDIDDIGNYWQSVGDTKKYSDYGTIMSSTGPTDQEQITGTVAWTGIALLQVQNIGSPKGNANQYTVAIKWSHQSKAPFTFIRRLAGKGSDTIKLPYEAGKGKARVTVRGDGSGVLTLDVLDPKGASVAKSQELKGTGYHDTHSLTWEPTVAGIYTVRICNTGNVGSEYVFTTD
jgi:S1-C subfamily serine protease